MQVFPGWCAEFIRALSEDMTYCERAQESRELGDASVTLNAMEDASCHASITQHKRLM